MGKSKSSNGKHKISQKELDAFHKLIKGHEKLLEAIGKL
jgi:hypothetical protein